MDYEKKYKEALEKASKIKLRNPIGRIQDEIDSIFPELKESEDERIRKAIIKYLDALDDDEIRYRVSFKDMRTWLEKQGEQKPQGKSPLEVWKDMRFEVYQQASGNRHEPNYSDDSTKMFSLTDIDEIFEKVAEKQGEQKKPTDKIEPKFKVGDWISGYYTNYKVLSVNNNGYVVEDVDGNKINILFENEKFHHLFTIADAKDGDVLCYEDEVFNEVFILKNYVLFHKIVYHCCYDGENFIPHSIYSLTKDDFNKIHPATKEQRNTLMKAMADAGYTFDFAKKELKKIEQKPAWSEVDEDMVDNIFKAIQHLLKENESWGFLEDCFDWLKSIKERMKGE